MGKKGHRGRQNRVILDGQQNIDDSLYYRFTSSLSASAATSAAVIELIYYYHQYTDTRQNKFNELVLRKANDFAVYFTAQNSRCFATYLTTYTLRNLLTH